jgi:hypothetical protein
MSLLDAIIENRLPSLILSFKREIIFGKMWQVNTSERLSLNIAIKKLFILTTKLVISTDTDFF